MRNSFFLFTLLSVILISCQKEPDLLTGGSGGSGGGGGGNTGGTRLVRTVSKTGPDSVVTVYTYNSNGKVVNVKTTGMSGGIDQANEFRYYRNSSGIITRKVQINPNLASAGVDSVITTVLYNSSLSRYTGDVSSLSAFGFTVSDSTVHVYDGSGKVIRTDEYQAIPSLGQPYELSLKSIYTYDAAGNVKQMDIYYHDATTNTDDLVATLKYTFDNKTAAISYGADAIGIGQVDLISVNNPLKAEFVDVTDPTNNQTFVFTYTYNSNNRPSTGTSTLTPGNTVSNLSYYYQ